MNTINGSISSSVLMTLNDQNESNEFTSSSISSQNCQSQQKFLMNKSKCNDTILNSPSSSCRLHVVSLNRQNIPTKQQHSEFSILNQDLISYVNQSIGNIQQKSMSSPSNITEFSDLSTPKSLFQLNVPTQTMSMQNCNLAHNYLNLPLLSGQSSRSASISKTIALMPQKLTSIDWLKFGFKILLMFTVLFWLFSIVTWMSIMPKTMPISLTIITSMMTIGLIISLIIQSEWPYSFEFIPNADAEDDSDDLGGVEVESSSIMGNCISRFDESNQNIKVGYKSISKDLFNNKFKELNSSGIENCTSNAKEITVIPIDNY